MSNVEWFYTIMSMGLAWTVLSFPYLLEKLVKAFWRWVMSNKFEDGYEYADQQLKLGVKPKELEKQIDDAFDFNDFDSGVIARWKECDNE